MKQKLDHPWRGDISSLANLEPHPENLIPGAKGEVEVEVLQRALKRSGLSKGEVARRMGWTRVSADTHRLNMALGFERPSNGSRQKTVTYRMAVRLCRALGASPVDLGL